MMKVTEQTSRPIFISYRRQDGLYFYALLRDRLTDHFGDQQVITDVDSIELGMDAASVIRYAIGKCRALVVIVGPQWLGSRIVEGEREIDNPYDTVRMEIEAAIARGIRIIPVLFEGAPMPRPQDLPESVAELALQDALEVHFDTYKFDVARLIEVLETNEPKKPAPSGELLGIEAKYQLKVFLCHSSSDKPAVRTLYNRLAHDGIQLWLDEKDILPGQDWDLEIRRAIRVCEVVLVCLSRGSITKVGYLQREIQNVLNVAEEQPDGTIFLIPVRLEPCDVPERIRKWQWVDLFESGGYERLMRALRERADTATGA